MSDERSRRPTADRPPTDDRRRPPTADDRRPTTDRPDDVAG
jgi:hypothetical protein